MHVSEYDDCWLRYDTVQEPTDPTGRICTQLYASTESPQLAAAREELRVGLSGLFDREPHLWMHPPRSVDGGIALGRRDRNEIVRAGIEQSDLDAIHRDGYILRTIEWNDSPWVIVTGRTDRGMLYGAFALLRTLATGGAIDSLDRVESPAIDDRVINQWDSPFRGSVERGYGGPSMFDWDQLPAVRDRYTDYARLLASVGINGIVLNNVNTHKPDRPGSNPVLTTRDGYQLLESGMLDRVQALAACFRRYGIRSYLAVDFAAPMSVGGLETADPTDETVRDWWHRKATELYERIPDFGGVLVKADSEGQPGPHAYDCDHATGANVLARAFGPHGGTVFWRAFVYGSHADRAVQAYETFAPLDGEFHDAVTLQVKNGPIDFQPREPVSTLFAGMEDTALACELQITQEYTGQAVHCCYLGPQFEEILDTPVTATGQPLAEQISTDESSAIVGVGAVGDDPNWTGHYLAQSNLYAFGRFSWSPTSDADAIADEWSAQTFGRDPAVQRTIASVLDTSWPAVVDYTTGHLGLCHMMYNGNDVLENHYDPAPEEWPGYHGATADGIGVDRSAYTAQYPPAIAEQYSDPAECPLELLLFFHHLPWEYERDGTPIVQRLYDNCFRGVARVERMIDAWEGLADSIDSTRHAHVASRLDEQLVQARRWRDELVTFFYTHSGIPDAHGRVPLTD